MNPPLSAAAEAAVATEKVAACEGEGVLPHYLVAKGDRDPGGSRVPKPPPKVRQGAGWGCSGRHGQPFSSAITFRKSRLWSSQILAMG